MDEAWLVDAAAWAAVGPYRAAPGAVVADSGVVRWFRTGIDFEGLNGVLWARLAERGLDGAIERALAPFREAGVPMLWHVGPTSSPRDLPRALEAAGLAHHESEPGMVADLAAVGPPPAAPAGLEILPVGDEDGLATWSRLWAGAPPDANVDGLVELRAPGALGPGRPVPHLLALLEGRRWGARPSSSATAGTARHRPPGSSTSSRSRPGGGWGSGPRSPTPAWPGHGRGAWPGPS